MPETPKPTGTPVGVETQPSTRRASIEIPGPPKSTRTTEEDELQNPTLLEMATSFQVMTTEEVEKAPQVPTTPINDHSSSYKKDPGEDQEVEAKKNLEDGDEETCKGEDYKIIDSFRNAAIFAVNEWVEYVLSHWLKSEDRRPEEFLSVVGWGDGPDFSLIAVPAKSPGVTVYLDARSGVDEPSVMCDRGGKEEGKTTEVTSSEIYEVEY